MSRQVRRIDVFLSSPDDVEPERDFIKRAAHEWNVLRSGKTGCHINILTWEDAVSPAFSDRPQSVINEGVGDQYDVYLGVMWGRFGSPTGVAESGTVEEFDRALDRYRQGEKLRLAMLFKMTPIPPATLSGEQFDKVQTFKKRYAENGLYREFDNEEMLRKIVNKLFEDIAAEHGGPEGVADTSETSSSARADSGAIGGSDTTLVRSGESESLIQRSEKYEDIGLFELNERITEVTTAQVGFLERMTEVNGKSTAAIDKANSEMQSLVNFGNATQSTLRAPMLAITQSMTETAGFLEENLPAFKERDDELIELTDIAFDISSDFAAPEGEEIDLRASVEELVGTLTQNRNSLDELIGTVQSLPRMTTEFNRAKKRLAGMQSDLRGELDRLIGRLGSILGKYDEAAGAEEETAV